MSTLKAEIQQPCAQAQKKAFWAFYSHFTKKNNPTANNTAKKHKKYGESKPKTKTNHHSLHLNKNIPPRQKPCFPLN